MNRLISIPFVIAVVVTTSCSSFGSLVSTASAFSPAAQPFRSTFRARQALQRPTQSLPLVVHSEIHQPSSPLVVSGQKAASWTSLYVSMLPTDIGSSASSSSSNDDNNNELPAKMPRGLRAPVVEINSPQELADFLDQDDRICVIKFHASWCKSCQRFGLKYQGLANQMTDWIRPHAAKSSNDSEAAGQQMVVRQGPMRFGSIEYGANLGMCRALQIQRLPTVHLYHKGRKLEAFSCGPSKFPLLQETVQHYWKKQQQEDDFVSILEQGSQLMASTSGGGTAGVNKRAVSSSAPNNMDSSHPEEDRVMEMAGILEHMIEQDANGRLESSKTTKVHRKKKSWWRNFLP